MIVTAPYQAETWNMEAAERKRLDVVTLICPRSMCGITRIIRLKSDGLRRRTGVVRTLADRADSIVMAWARRENEKMVFGEEETGSDVRDTSA